MDGREQTLKTLCRHIWPQGLLHIKCYGCPTLMPDEILQIFAISPLPRKHRKHSPNIGKSPLARYILTNYSCRENPPDISRQSDLRRSICLNLCKIVLRPI